MTGNTSRQRADEVAIQLCEKWFDDGERASWSASMASELADALLDARRDALAEAVKCLDDNAHKGPDAAYVALNRLREGVK